MLLFLLRINLMSSTGDKSDNIIIFLWKMHHAVTNMLINYFAKIIMIIIIMKKNNEEKNSNEKVFKSELLLADNQLQLYFFGIQISTMYLMRDNKMNHDNHN